MIGKKIKLLRGQKTQEDVANGLGISRARLGHYESGRSEPDNEMLTKIADYFNVSVDFLLGRTEKQMTSNDLPILTKKDERDIAKKLEAIINELESDTSLAFDGEPMDEHTRELVLSQIESNLQLAKRLAKKKFTPKKYRNE